MKSHQPTLSTALFIGLVCLVFSSCNIFGDYDEIPVAPCSATPINIIDTLPRDYGTVSRIQFEIDSTAVFRWVILPDSLNTRIYTACNFPAEIQKNGQRVYFSAYVLENTGPVQDPILNGFMPIEIIYIQKD